MKRYAVQDAREFGEDDLDRWRVLDREDVNAVMSSHATRIMARKAALEYEDAHLFLSNEELGSLLKKAEEMLGDAVVGHPPQDEAGVEALLDDEMRQAPEPTRRWSA